MKRRLQTMVLGMGFLAMGCAGGVQDLGTMQLPDGQTVYATQFRTKEHGPEIIAVEMFSCTKPVPDHPTVCEPYMHMHSSGNSGGVAIFNGAGTAAVGALSLGLPAHLVRPATSSTTMEQETGAVTSGSSSGSMSGGSTSRSDSTSVSKATGGTGGTGMGGEGGQGGLGGVGTAMSQSVSPAMLSVTTPAPLAAPHRSNKHHR